MRNFGQVWGPSSPTTSCRKTMLPEGTPLDLQLPHGKIVIILQCNSCRVAERSSRLSHTKIVPAKWADRAFVPKIPWTLSPLDMSTYTEFGPDQLHFARLIPERSIFRPKKSIQYRLSAYNKQLEPAQFPDRYISVNIKSWLFNIYDQCLPCLHWTISHRVRIQPSTPYHHQELYQVCSLLRRNPVHSEPK